MDTLLKGLSASEAEQLAAAGKANVVPNTGQKTTWQIIRDNIFTYFNLIFAVLAGLLIATGNFRNLTFLPVVIANMLIGIVQQLRSKKVLDELTVLSAAKCAVLRDGKVIEVPVDTLVLGDVIFLDEGKQIPADAEVLEGTVSVNESLLTGESDEIEKKPGAELMSGSFTVSGRCYARLTKVGADSYAAGLTAEAKSIETGQSEMVRGIDTIVKVAGILIIPIGVLLMLQGVFANGLSIARSVEAMVGAVIGMIPEGLYLLVTVALALSAARLATKKVLLHDMKSTETLARVDVLCVDKTGTITDNAMNVTAVFASTEISPDPANVPAASDEPALPPVPGDVESELARYVGTVTDGNITMVALKDYFTKIAFDDDVKVTPFSSKTKYSQIETKDGIYRLGAPEFVLSEQSLAANASRIAVRTGKGERVLAFAKAGKADEPFAALAFVALENGIRAGVEDTFAYLQEQEVVIKVISGDNPRTVSEIAKQVGIAGAERYVDAQTLSTEEDYLKAVHEYTVFGRVKPEQKKALVTAIQTAGKKVAMTGDGVNDILAMKTADCSIAMGAGSDAAMQAAQVVLLDSDFSRMKDIIGEGRRDINNITRSATLFLYKNIFSMLLALFSIVTFFVYPLKPTQVSLISGLNIGIPAFFLALEANLAKQQGSFIKTTLMSAIPAAVTSFAGVAAMVLFADLFHISAQDVSTASTYLLSVVGFMVLIRICAPLNTYRVTIIVLSIIAFIVVSQLLGDLFGITNLSAVTIVLTTVFAIAEESVMRNLGKLLHFLDERLIQRYKRETA